MKRFFVLLSIFSLTACLPSTPPEDTTGGTSASSPSFMEEEDDGEVMENDEDELLEDEDEEGEDEDDEEMSEKRVIEVSVDNWTFSPASITAKKGENVEIKLTGVTGTHGFTVPGLGISLTVNAGETLTVALPTDTEGTFEFFCSIPCGAGHKDMRGTITIE